MFLPRATRRTCFRSPESLARASSTFAHRFTTSSRTELARNSPGSGNPVEEHDVAERIDHGIRGTGYERVAGGPVRRARRLRTRPFDQIRQSPPSPENSSSSEDDPNEIAVGELSTYQVSKVSGHQAVPDLIDADVNIR
jgi:hypothetical protein